MACRIAVRCARMYFSPALPSIKYCASRWVPQRRAFCSETEHHTAIVPQNTGTEDTLKVLSLAERVRALVESRISGYLSTVYLGETEMPKNEPIKLTAQKLPLIGSIMPYVLDSRGTPIFGLFPDEAHTKNIARMPKVSMVVFPLTPQHIIPTSVPLPRVNLIGDATELQEGDKIAETREKFSEIHPGSAPFLARYQFFTLSITDVIYHLGFQDTTSHIEASAYHEAPVDVVAKGSRLILERLNQPHYSKALAQLCKEYGDTVVDEDSPFVFSVDRFGFNVLATTEAGKEWHEFRFPLAEEMKSSMHCLLVLEGLVRQKWRKYSDSERSKPSSDKQTN